MLTAYKFMELQLAYPWKTFNDLFYVLRVIPSMFTFNLLCRQMKTITLLLMFKFLLVNSLTTYLLTLLPEAFLSKTLHDLSQVERLRSFMLWVLNMLC